MNDGSVVTQVHPIHEMDCYRLEYGTLFKRDSMILSADHILLCDISKVDGVLKNDILNDLRGCSIPKKVDYHVTTEKELTPGEQAELAAYLTGDDTIRAENGEESCTPIQDILDRCEFQEEIVESDSAIVHDNEVWLTVEIIHQLIKYDQKVRCNGRTIYQSRYIGPKQVRCVSTDSGEYESRGLIHHNSVAVRNIIMHCLTHSADMSVALVDLKQTEFTYFKGKKGVVGVANEVQEAVELLRIARDVMYKRNREMAALGLTDIVDFKPKEPTDRIWVSGRDLHEDEVVKVRVDGGEEQEMTAAELLEFVNKE